MKKFIIYIVITQLFMLLTWPAMAQFQPTEVVRSKEKTIVNGKLYYIHTVQKGQTLYSISKVYQVTQEEIKLSNPQVDVVNLVEGLAIRIPDTTARQAVLYPQNKEDFHAHTVRRRETVYSISKKYKVDEQVIYQYNPWAREGVKADQTLWIPKNAATEIIQETSTEGFYFYTAKDRDTLYSIARHYGVTVSDIINSNPDLRNGLRPGQILKIPKKQLLPEDMAASDSLSADSASCMAPDQPVAYKVALMLPFFANFNIEELVTPADTIAEEGTYVPQQRQQGLRGRNFAEFYEGFLLALDSLKKTGLSVDLNVYDTERDTARTKKIVQELSIFQPDLIIGPVYSEDVHITGRLARYQDVQLVSPLSTRSTLVERNTNIIQVIPSRQSESYALANFLKQYNKGRIILIRGTDTASMRNSWRFKKYLMQNMPVDISGNPLYFADYRLNDSLKNNLGTILSKEEENLLIVFSDSEPDVNLLITKIIQRASLFPVVLFGMPSWQSWTNIDLTFYHSLQLHLIMPFYADFSGSDVKRFLRKCRTQYGYEPYEISPLGYNFSMLGYDIGFYFLSALKQFGNNFTPCIDQVHAEQLLTKYDFQRAGNGGYVNNNFNIIRYRNDFTIERVGIINGMPVIHEAINSSPAVPSGTTAPLIPFLQQ